MGSRKLRDSLNPNPGPGQYNPNVGAAKENIGGVKIGTSKRDGSLVSSKDMPGPGNYNPSSSIGGHGFGFGSSTRKISGKD